MNFSQHVLFCSIQFEIPSIYSRVSFLPWFVILTFFIYFDFVITEYFFIFLGAIISYIVKQALLLLPRNKNDIPSLLWECIFYYVVCPSFLKNLFSWHNYMFVLSRTYLREEVWKDCSCMPTTINLNYFICFEYHQREYQSISVCDLDLSTSYIA